MGKGRKGKAKGGDLSTLLFREQGATSQTALVDLKGFDCLLRDEIIILIIN